MDDNEISKIRERLKLYTLTNEEIEEEFNKFKNAGGELLLNKKKGVLYKKLNKHENNKNASVNNAKSNFVTQPLIKQAIKPDKPKNKKSKNNYFKFINNLKIDLFAVKNKTKVKTGFDIIRSLLSIFSYKISDYVNNKFIDTIHIDILQPLNDISFIAKELMKITNKELLKNPEIIYLLKVFECLNAIDTLAVTSYLATLESKTSPPYKYYEISPILKNLYVPLVKLDKAYKTNQIKTCLIFLSKMMKDKSRLIATFNDMIDKYFNILKKALYVILLKDMGGIFYEFDNDSPQFRTKQLRYFNLTEDDILEGSLNEFIEKHNLKYNDKENEEEIEELDEYNPYAELPSKYNDILEILNEFFPSCIFELKYKQNNFDKSSANKIESKFDIRQISSFTDIFRYFYSPNDITNYILDDRFLHFSRFYPLSQLIVFLLMIVDLFSGLVNINYSKDATTMQNDEQIHYAIFFKNILNELVILHKFTISKIGDIIRDISLSYSDNSEYLKTSSFELYLDEMTIFLKNNYLPQIEFNKTINGLSIYDQKFVKYDAKKTLFIDPFYIIVKKLKNAVDEICTNIDKRNKNQNKIISPKDLESIFKEGPTFNQKSTFYQGFKSVFIKTDYDGTKLVTKDQRTLYNYLFFVQKFIDLINFIVNSNKSYLLNYAYPSILRAQPNKLLRVIDEGTNSLAVQSKNIFLSPIIKQRLQEKQELILENIKLKEEIEKSKIHTTSGVFSKKYFLDYFPKLIEESKNENKKLSLLIMDLDNFKSLNDSAGHKFGDFVLENVGRMLKDILRKDDLITNYKGETKNLSLNKFASCFGGDEFVLLLTHTDIKNAKIVAERILDELNNNVNFIINKEYQNKLLLKLNNKEINQSLYEKLSMIKYSMGASIGLAELDNDFTEDKFFDYADTGVYASKMNGKNSFSLYDKQNGYKVYKKVNNVWNENIYSYEDVKSWQAKNDSKNL
jgi:diguanylate cyclase (GGDEF)-like protein